MESPSQCVGVFVWRMFTQCCVARLLSSALARLVLFDAVVEDADKKHRNAARDGAQSAADTACNHVAQRAEAVLVGGCGNCMSADNAGNSHIGPRPFHFVLLVAETAGLPARRYERPAGNSRSNVTPNTCASQEDWQSIG